MTEGTWLHEWALSVAISPLTDEDRRRYQPDADVTGSDDVDGRPLD